MPIIQNSRTLLPIRTIVESMGGTIDWDSTLRKVIIKHKDKVINLWIDSNNAEINGTKTSLDVAPTIINERTMMPLRFISENLGFIVSWDDVKKEITITN